MTNVIEQLNGELTHVVRHVHNSLVQITNGRSGAGAGTIWNAEGLIITNAHVVHQSRPNVTLPGGQSLPANIVAYDAERDLALLSVKARGLTALALGDSRNLQPGQWVMAVGHPFGLTGAATSGIIIGPGHDLPEAGGRGQAAAKREWLMISLVLRPGNSGGPLVDSQGRLLGVNTIMTGPQVGGAVPVHVVKTFLDEAMLN